MAKWRPSGEGTAHGTAGPPKKGVLTGCTTPLDSQRTFELPFKSSCRRREPSLVRLETKSFLPSSAQSRLCRLLRSLAVMIEDALPSRRKRSMVFCEYELVRLICLIADIVGSQQKTSSATIPTGARSLFPQTHSFPSCSMLSCSPLGRHHCHPKSARPLHRGCRGRRAQCLGG